MAEKKLSFTGINILVCFHCEHIMMGKQRDGYSEGCKLKKKDGKYARISLGGETESDRKHGIETVNGFYGCENFKSSGIPEHPQNLERLIKKNPKCSEIPSSSEATETGWAFSEKMKNYLPSENWVSYKEIQ
jgi:hypothetical protein